MPADNEGNQSPQTPDCGNDPAAVCESSAVGHDLAPEPDTLTDPVAVNERISAVDVLRGVALLGILLINITSFGLPYEGKSSSARLLAQYRHDCLVRHDGVVRGKDAGTFFYGLRRRRHPAD